MHPPSPWVKACWLLVAWHESEGVRDPLVDEVAEAVEGRRDVHCGIGGTVSPRPDVTADERALYDRIVSTRRSVRNFSPEPVAPALLDQAITMANYSPSVCNRQPWTLAMAQKPNMVRHNLNLQGV